MNPPSPCFLSLAWSFYHRKTFLIFRLIEDRIYSVPHCAAWALQIQMAFDVHDPVIRCFKTPTSANVFALIDAYWSDTSSVFSSLAWSVCFFAWLNFRRSSQRRGHSTASSNWLQCAVYGLWEACWDAAWHVWLEWSCRTSARQVLCHRLFETELWSVMWKTGLYFYFPLHQSSHQTIAH